MVDQFSTEDLSAKDQKLKAELDDIINDCLEGARKFFSDRENARIRFEGLDLTMKTKKEKWQSKYISPFPATSVEQKAAYLTEALTSLGPDFIEYLPYDNIEEEEQTNLLTRLVAYYLSKSNTIEKVYLYNKDMLIYGTGIAKIYYNYRERKVTRKVGRKMGMMDGSLAEFDVTEEKSKVEKDQPDFKVTELNNFWPDKEGSGLDDFRHIVERELITFKRMESYQKTRNLRNLNLAKKAGIPKRNFGKLSMTTATKQGRAGRTAEYNVDQIINFNTDKGKNNPVCELLTIYRPGTVQLVLNGIPISDEEPYYDDIRYPFIISRNQPINGEFWGRSDMDIIENNIRHHEEMANLIKDNYVEHLRPTRLLDMSLGQEAIKRLQNAQPGAQIAVPDTDGVVELRPTPFDTTAVNYAQGFLDEAKASMAINPLMEGQNPGSGIRSEGSLELFQQIGSTRMSLLVNTLAYEFGRMGEMFVQLIKQFGNEEISFAVTGKLSESYSLAVRPVNLPDNVQCRVLLSTIADNKRQQRIAQMLQLITQAAQLDQLGTFRSERAMVEVFIESRLFEDGQELYEKDPNVIMARATLAANAAGKPSPTVTGGLNPGVGAMGQQQAPGGGGGAFPGQQPAPQPATNPQRPQEGNPQGVN